MLNIGEYRRNPDRVSDLLPWAALIAPGVVLNKDGSFQRSISFRGPDLDSATEAELVATASRINNAFKRLGSGWAIFLEAQRALSDWYPEATFTNPIAFLIDEERRSFFQTLEHFESHYFLTLVYLPPPDVSERLAAYFVENSNRKSVDYRAQLTAFSVETERIIDLLRGVLPQVSLLDDQETLTYLHSTISCKRHPVRVPEIPMYLDALLADTPLIAGLEPRLGTTHLKTITVRGFPGSSIPGILDGLNRLAVEYRWSTRFIPLDKTEAVAELTKYKRQWFAKRKGIVTMIKELIVEAESPMHDSDAENKALDADSALQEVADDLVSYGYFTASVVLWDEDPARLEAKTRDVEKIINGLGFVTATETINAVETWLGSLPGHCRANVRRPLLNSLNLAHLMPLSAVWAGPEENRHLQASVLLHAITAGSTPYRLSLHVGDVGHAMVIGPTGAGKDVFLATVEAQFLRYRNAQIYIFDKGGSSRALTAGIGGEFYDLGSEGSLSFQPLAEIDDELERGWAAEWILDLLRQENILSSPVIKAEVWNALSSLATAPVTQRTISGLIALSQNTAIRQALNPFSIDGPHGHIFDATGDTLNYSRWQSFEMEILMHTPVVVAPALSYLFHKLEKRFTGPPILLILNEAWVFFDNPVFAPKIREWLKVLRKQNVSVIFATQNLTDVENCPISSALIESCPTRIFLPNHNALQEETARIYQRFGLNERQVRILAMSQPKRQYYYQSPLGNRLFELGLGPLAMAYCAVSSREEQAVIKELLAQHGREGFNAAWLDHKNLSWAAELL